MTEECKHLNTIPIDTFPASRRAFVETAIEKESYYFWIDLCLDCDRKVLNRKSVKLNELTAPQLFPNKKVKLEYPLRDGFGVFGWNTVRVSGTFDIPGRQRNDPVRLFSPEEASKFLMDNPGEYRISVIKESS
jgi:hypothetical protein